MKISIPTADAYRLSATACRIAPYVLSQKFKSGSVIYNADKVRLCDDILLSRLKSGSGVCIQRTDYYSALATNGASFVKYFREMNEELYDGYSLFTTGARITTLRQSQCANIIGIDVLAITSDGKLLIQLQSDQNAQGANELVPSACGSVEWSDVSDVSTFDDLVRRAAVRELVEETGLPDSSIVTEFKLLGYTLDVGRGMKPDFYGLAHLSIHSEAVSGLPREGFTHWHLPVDLRLGSLVDLQADIEALKEKYPRLNDFLQISLNLLLKYVERQAVVEYADV